MSENVPFSFGDGSESVPSFSNIDVGTSNILEQFGVTTTTIDKSSSDDYNMGATCSSGKGKEAEEGGLLYDIFKVLSEVPLHSTQALNESFHHYLEASTSKNEECFMEKEKEKGFDDSHDYANIVAQPSQINEGREAKEESQETSQLVSGTTHTPPFGETHDHVPIRVRTRRHREQRRRALVNAKLRDLRALLPHSNKRDHASILDNAINHIKHLKQQLEMNSTRLTGQSEQQASYNPSMIVGGPGFTHWPLQFPRPGQHNYPSMIGQPNFALGPVPHFPFTPHMGPGAVIPPLLLPPQPEPSTPPIRLQPPNPYRGVSNSSTSQGTNSSTMGQCN